MEFALLPNSTLPQEARFSTSCPALNEEIQDCEKLKFPFGRSSIHQCQRKKDNVPRDALYPPEIQRRNSWSAVENLIPKDWRQHHRDKRKVLRNEEDDDPPHIRYDNTNFSDDIPLISTDIFFELPLTAADLCPDVNLGLHENEPDSWTSHVGKDVAKKLKEKEVKRQEHIYEFILTEKHHCITLLVMQKIFVDGIQRYFHLGLDLERMFPRLTELIEFHLELLSRLRQRQKESVVVSTIADILLQHFSCHNAAKLKSVYGEFCSKHGDAVGTYKYYLERDARFQHFVRHCQSIALLKKKGIPECILFTTLRLTKYPLLIEPLIKTSKDNQREQDLLQKALSLVKEILVEVNAQVAEKEKEDRKLEIFDRIDSKSYTMHKNEKFNKSDILQNNRSLKFEGVAMLKQEKGKMQTVLVIVLSDVLFFLQESPQNYTFFTPDNKAGVISLQKLLIREKAGQDAEYIYLISSNPADPEMFELKVQKPKDKHVWIHAIREAVQACPGDEDDLLLHIEDKKSLLSARQNLIWHLVDLLRSNDIEQALLLDEKMPLQLKPFTAEGIDPASFRSLLSENVDTGQIWKELLTAVQEKLTALDSSNSISSGRDQEYTAIQLTHYLYTIFGIISQLTTSSERYQVQGLRQFRHNLQLEELRNLQDKLSAEKAAWVAHRDQEAKELEEKKAELLKLQEQLKSEEEDIKAQREQLFRTMEKLTSKGLLISPNVGMLSLSSPIDDNSKNSPEGNHSNSLKPMVLSTNSFNSKTLTLERRKENKLNRNASVKSQLPTNLISTTNQQKASQNVQIKQQIPFKLASRSSSAGSPSTSMGNTVQMLPLKLSQDEKVRRTSASGYQRLGTLSGDAASTLIRSHNRIGSSPAMIHASPPGSRRQHRSQGKPTNIQNSSENDDEGVIYF